MVVVNGRGCCGRTRRATLLTLAGRNAKVAP